MDKDKRQPTTIYLDPKIARAVKVQAALNDKSVSDLVNDVLSQKLRQDAEDRRIYRETKGQKGRPLEDVLEDMQRDGLL